MGQSLTRSESVFWRHSRAHMKAPSNTTLDVKLPVTPSPAPLLSLKSITPETFYDRVDFGRFHRATHLWNQTPTFQKMIATPTPNKTSTVATVWHCRKSWLPRHYDPPWFGLVLLWAQQICPVSWHRTHGGGWIRSTISLWHLEMSSWLTPVALENQMSCGDGWTQIGPATLILAAHTPVTSSWWTADLSPARAAVKTTYLLSTSTPEFVAAS